MEEPDDFIEQELKQGFDSQVFLFCLSVVGGLFAGWGFVAYFVYRELKLESDFRLQYGDAWKSEFEKYHGSLSHAHTKMAVGIIGMLMVVAILAWMGRSVLHRRKSHRHHHRTSSL